MESWCLGDGPQRRGLGKSLLAAGVSAWLENVTRYAVGECRLVQLMLALTLRKRPTAVPKTLFPLSEMEHLPMTLILERS